MNEQKWVWRHHKALCSKCKLSFPKSLEVGVSVSHSTLFYIYVLLLNDKTLSIVILLIKIILLFILKLCFITQ
jgi:hypothetical protein